MRNLFHLSALFAVLTLFSCTGSEPSKPMCRFSSEVLARLDALQTNSASEVTAAACLIKVDKKVLLIRHRLSNKLDFPGGGLANSESPACAAHRETWEETGFNVEVSQYLATTKNGLALFGCALDAGVETFPDAFDAPPWAKLEVKGLEKVDPFSIDEKSMRFADDLIPLRDGYTQFVINQH
ncbi:NUDIX hydrolase [Alteromonas sp. IB21]|nr:NUDIX hydrolase [Alteromonas sp. IB21]